jgi:hypothetical protein
MRIAVPRRRRTPDGERRVDHPVLIHPLDVPSARRSEPKEEKDGVAVAEPDVVAERGRRLHVGVAELRCHAAAEPGAAELAQEDL